MTVVEDEVDEDVLDVCGVSCPNSAYTTISVDFVLYFDLWVVSFHWLTINKLFFLY